MLKYFFTLTFLISLCSHAQVNAYARITAISGSVLTLSNIDETNDAFVTGEYVIVIQMQGASISNTSDNSGFGTLNSLNSAGLYEVARISAVNTGASSMTLTSSLTNAYSTSGRVQVVSYPALGSSSGYTTTANLSATGWNGSVGGVLTFSVGGNLYLSHDLSVDGDGFRGGDDDGDDGSSCEDDVWRTSSNDGRYADKGEGVYRVSSSEAAGKAKAVNGGGGGIVHNGGGGGGGNFTAGGAGYYGYPGDGCGSSNDAGGQGGLAITSSATRLFLGGGGGGGQENNSQGSDGGDGGGIIILTCDTVVVTGTCGSREIRSGGETAVNSGQDGAGGGGAGGTILLNIKGFRVPSTCQLTVSADGGDGADVVHSDTHGSGGGGGQGAIYLNTSNTFSHVTLSTNFGIGGLINDVSTTRAGSGGGPANSGIFSTTFTSPLPITLVGFTAKESGVNEVLLEWNTASEINNKHFEIYHSVNGGDWSLIGTMDGAGTSMEEHNYSYRHYGAKTGINYYKLKQVDFNQDFKFSNITFVSLKQTKIKVTVFPNPGNELVNIECSQDISGESLTLVNSLGVKEEVIIEKINATVYRLNISSLPEGLYFLQSQNIREIIMRKGNP